MWNFSLWWNIGNFFYIKKYKLYIYIKLTELLFRGIFNDMEPAAIAAILSSLMYDESSSSEKFIIKNESVNKAYLEIVE